MSGSAAVTVRLRAHHLLCLLTYVGKGYTPAFTANYDAVVARLDAGEDRAAGRGPGRHLRADAG